MATPQGWVSPQWASLSRRPLWLGLPWGVAAIIVVLSLYIGVVLKLIVPALVFLVISWSVGAAVTRYDRWGGEVLWAALRMPRVLR
jgi:hypothetical protein